MSVLQPLDHCCLMLHQTSIPCRPVGWPWMSDQLQTLKEQWGLLSTLLQPMEFSLKINLERTERKYYATCDFSIMQWPLALSSLLWGQHYQWVQYVLTIFNLELCAFMVKMCILTSMIFKHNDIIFTTLMSNTLIDIFRWGWAFSVQCSINILG